MTAELVLGEGEVRFREMADGAPVLIRVSDVDGKCTWFNRIWLDWTGRQMAEELGDGWAEGVHPQDLERCLSIYRGALGRREAFEMEYRLRRADGEYGWVLDRGVPRKDAEGNFIGHLGSCTDITELKHLQTAGRAAHDRIRRLQAITSALSGASTADAVIDVVLSEAIPAIGASDAIASLLSEDGTHLEVAGVDGYRPEVIDAIRRCPLDAPLPLAKAARLGVRLQYESREAMLADNPGMTDLVPQPPDRAMAAIPLAVKDRLLGSFAVTWPKVRRLAPEDLAFLDSVAGQLAQALDRTRLYEAEAEARAAAETSAERLAFLAEASRILGASLDLEETLSRLAKLAAPRLADWCAVHLLDEQDRPRAVAAAHADPERAAIVRDFQDRWPPRWDATAGLGAVLRTGRSQLYPKMTDELLQKVAHDEEHLAILRDLGLGSAVFVALRDRGGVVGGITLVNDAPREAGEEDLALAEEFAARASAAVFNARRFTERSRIARSLQASLLPASLPSIPGADVAAAYLAAGEGEVGGDFYDAFPAGSERWLLAIGDVRGKGVEAAAVTGLTRHTIRCAALHSRTPRRILADLNTVLLRNDWERSDEALPLPRFCTVCLLALRRMPTGFRVTVCAAGHPLPVVVRADGRVEELGRPGMLLGVLERPDLYETRAMLYPGDTLVCFTDGITERRRDGRFFEDQLAEILIANAGLEAASSATALRQAARDFATDAPVDDMALLVLRVTDPAPAGV